MHTMIVRHGGGPATDHRMAIVHEWVQARAGSEQVFEFIAQQFPDADLWALTAEPGVRLDVGGRRIRTTWLDVPKVRRHRELTLPLMPLAWWTTGPRRSYDVVITSHHAFATQNKLTRADGRHFAYVHSPARYLWHPDVDPRGQGLPQRIAAPPLRRLDRRRARDLHGIAANSNAVAARVRDAWDVDCRVLHPPVDTEFFAPGLDETIEVPAAPGFLLGLGRWIEYKNMARVIEVGTSMGIPTVIAGRGPLGRKLREQAREASTPVHIVESPSDALVRELLRRAGVLVFPTVEDFGIVPVEAQAVGTPVVAPRAGGVLETVLDGRTGALVEDTSTDALAEGVSRALDMDTSHCAAHAQSFSRQAFAQGLAEWTGLPTRDVVTG
jgi:glycosyltransferase involved in cell wall biosynthesis